MTSGDTMSTGRVLRISEPSLGSKRASQISNRFIGAPFGPLPVLIVPRVRGLTKGLQLLEIPFQVSLRDVLQGLHPNLHALDADWAKQPGFCCARSRPLHLGSRTS